MKSRPRPFDCSIAGKLVGISLRHGGGLQEPDRVYVRCEERDCQYVDENVAPCPLRVDMFADGSDDRVLDYLVQHTGTRVCYACLTDALEISHDQVRRASWRLKEESAFTIRPSRCALCRQRRVTIGRAGAPAPVLAPGPASPRNETGARKPLPVEPVQVRRLERLPDPSAPDVATYLRARPGYSFCVHCLARELKTQPSLMREALWTLDPEPEFDVRTSQCVACLLSKRVIRYQEPTTETTRPRRVIEFLAQGSGQLFCPSCVAFSTDLPLTDVRRVLGELEGVEEFARRDASCASCGRWQSVIGMRAPAEVSPERLAELGALLDGHVRHRDLLIGVLSYRTSRGWRPFALVKTSAGAIVPQAPAILLGLMSSKLEADALAVQHAREWIDKQYP